MDRGGFLWRAVAGFIAAIFIIMLTAFIMTDAPRDEAPDPGTLAIDTSNAAAMHEYGMPTKTDVLEWHVHGHWAYRANGHSFVYADLPGGSEPWDALYGVGDNDVFIK